MTDNNNNSLPQSPICLFDSGLGGLTVLKKLITTFPNESYIYLADLANVPFGDKSKSEIKEIATNIIEWLNKFNPKVIIMACNTSSAVLREQGRINPAPTIPIHGIIESCAKEIAKSNYKKVSVWATKLVVENNGYKHAIQKHNSDIEIEEIACPKLVPMIEGLSSSQNDKKEIIKEYIDKISNDSEALILGCTHYPLIQSEIKELRNIKIIDPTDSLISNLSPSTKGGPAYGGQSSVISPSKITLYATAQVEKLEKFAKLYLMRDFEIKAVSIKRVSIAS